MEKAAPICANQKGLSCGVAEPGLSKKGPEVKIIKHFTRNLKFSRQVRFKLLYTAGEVVYGVSIDGVAIEHTDVSLILEFRGYIFFEIISRE